MRDRELYAQLLGIESPWVVSRVELTSEAVEVYLESGAGKLPCPECGAASARYDSRERRWRHLDTMQYRTVLVADVPRVKCDEHGVRQVRVPWAEPGSGFTALFERLAIDWLLVANLSAVSRQLRLSWDQMDGIQQRAVARGLARRELAPVRHLGVDETSFQRRHEYVTVVVDGERGTVVHVADSRKREALADFLEAAAPEWLAQVETVAMDMWGPYISAASEHLEKPHERIVFDKFHVAKLLGDAVDRVRREEHRRLRSQGDSRLNRTRYFWLRNPDHMTPEQAARFEDLRASTLKTARAWAIKELAMTFWETASEENAESSWASWYSWAIRSRLAPIQKAARTIRHYLWGILNAMRTGVTNAMAEGLNTKIQALKRAARGFRNRDRFRTAIYFHLSGLDLYPRPVAHTTS
jgi:transposase